MGIEEMKAEVESRLKAVQEQAPQSREYIRDGLIAEAAYALIRWQVDNGKEPMFKPVDADDAMEELPETLEKAMENLAYAFELYHALPAAG